MSVIADLVRGATKRAWKPAIRRVDILEESRRQHPSQQKAYAAIRAVCDDANRRQRPIAIVNLEGEAVAAFLKGDAWYREARPDAKAKLLFGRWAGGDWICLAFKEV